MIETRTVMTIGTFDLFHAGHVNLLRQCRNIAGKEGKLMVGLNTDRFIANYKGKPPVINYQDRLVMLLTNRYVDVVFPYNGPLETKALLEDKKPDFLVVGSDWAVKDYYKQMNITQSYLDNLRIQLVYVPYTESISTTEIKRRIVGQ